LGEMAGRPSGGWVWPAKTASGHIQSSTTIKQHRKALRLSGVRPFVLYSLRHTFLTRLASDCGTLFDRHVRSLRPPEPRCRDECIFPVESTQGASRHRQSYPSLIPGEKGPRKTLTLIGGSEGLEPPTSCL